VPSVTKTAVASVSASDPPTASTAISGENHAGRSNAGVVAGVVVPLVIVIVALVVVCVVVRRRRQRDTRLRNESPSDSLPMEPTYPVLESARQPFV
jgi:hypothetical protein